MSETEVKIDWRAVGIVATAADLVAGNRSTQHGDKVENHQYIAALWTAYLGVTITADQVALMMVLLKVARTKTGALNRDDFVDMAGYAGVAGEIMGRFNGLHSSHADGAAQDQTKVRTP